MGPHRTHREGRGPWLTALVTLACLCSSPTAAAAQDPPAPAPRQDAERERIRIFRLVDGELLRVRSRWREGRWELFEGRGWNALEPARVSASADERSLLLEAARRSARLAPGDRAGRVELAGWMLAQGLVPESLGELERVLREDPDHAAAQALLARHPRPADFPPPEVLRADPGAALRQLLALGTAGGPARRELVIRELGANFGAGSLERVLEHALRNGSDRRRAFAALALGRLVPGGALRALYDRAALDPVEEVRREAALTLRNLGEEGLILPLVRALESEHGAVRAHAAQSLGFMGFAAAVPALRAHLARVGSATAAQGGGGVAAGLSGSLQLSKRFAYVRDYDIEIAQAASIADPVVGVGSEGVLLDVRLGGVYTMSVARERRMVLWALAALAPEER